jgi:hypothetical protein
MGKAREQRPGAANDAGARAHRLGTSAADLPQGRLPGARPGRAGRCHHRREHPGKLSGPCSRPQRHLRNPAKRRERTPTVLGRTHHQARRPLAAPGGDRLPEPAVGLIWFAAAVFGLGARAGHLADPLHQRCRPGSRMMPLGSHGANEMACCGALDFDGTEKAMRQEKGERGLPPAGHRGYADLAAGAQDHITPQPLGAGAGSGAPACSRVQKALKSGMPAWGERRWRSMSSWPSGQ